MQTMIQHQTTLETPEQILQSYNPTTENITDGLVIARYTRAYEQRSKHSRSVTK